MKTFHRIIHALLATLSFVAVSGAVAWAEEAPSGDRTLAALHDAVPEAQ